jgi:hypothetical protein
VSAGGGGDVFRLARGAGVVTSVGDGAHFVITLALVRGCTVGLSVSGAEGLIGVCGGLLRRALAPQGRTGRSGGGLG